MEGVGNGNFEIYGVTEAILVRWSFESGGKIVCLPRCWDNQWTVIDWVEVDGDVKSEAVIIEKWSCKSLDELGNLFSKHW